MPKHAAKIALTLVLAFAASLAAAESLESIEQKVLAASEKVTTTTADFDMDMTMGEGPRAVNSKGSGKMEALNKDGAARFRMEMTTTMQAGPQPMEQKILSVFDGDFLYTQTEMMGQTMAMKMKLDELQVNQGGMTPLGPKAMFEQMRKTFDITVAPEEQVNGRDAYVLDMTPKADSDKASPAGLGKMRVYLDKKTGMTLQTTMFDKAGKAVMTQTMKNIKINPAIEPSRFVYTPPAGVTVMDMSQMGAMMGPRE